MNGSELIGYAQLRWSGTADCVTGCNPTEIQRMYIDKPWHGKGIAQALMERCIAFAEARGSDRIWLGVWERNPKATAFYKKFEFVDVGSHVFPLGNDPQRDIIMARNVKPAVNIKRETCLTVVD